MSRATGRAKHPHDSSRPSSKAVKKALASGNMDALRAALTPRQRLFAEEYIIDFNASAAAVRAGYSLNSVGKQAYLLLHNDGVSAYIDHLMKSRESRIAAADPDYVVQKVMKIVNKDAVRDGDALRGLELLARILGMLKDRTEISGPDGAAIEVAQRTKEEADGLIAALNTLARRHKPTIELD